LNILAIETATEMCGIAYYENGVLQAVEEENIPRQHARSLPMFYKTLQDKTKFSLNILDGIAISIGPGSFTGLRIGLSFTKGLAYSHDLPIIPVPTLQAIASERNHDEEFYVLLFSHRDMIFHQLFSGAGQLISDPAVNKWADLKSEVENKTCIHVNCDKFLEDHQKAKKVQPSAKNVGTLALNHFEEWVEKKPYKLVPNYIAPFEMNKPA
jgi:tRNA threonylcarbamoyladenosine biosynthesis protein TsaB